MAYRGIVRKITANCWLTLARSSSVPHRPSRLVAWLFLAMATLVSGFGSLQAVDSVVTLTAPLTQAYEADPSRYGMLQITRSNDVDILTVRVDITPSRTGSIYPRWGIQYSLELDPISSTARATLAASTAGPFSNAFDVTFPIGLSTVFVRVVAIPDNSIFTNPGLLANFQLTNDQPGIVVGAQQNVSIEIIEKDIVLQTVALNPYIRETIPADVGAVTQSRNFGEAQLLFNSPTAPFTSRFVEAMLDGSATLGEDFVVTYRIGTSRVFDTLGSFDFPVVPVFPNAYRRSTEYGAGNINAVPMVDLNGVIIAGDAPAGTPRVSTTQFSVDGGYAVPAGGVRVSMLVSGVTVTSWVETRLDDDRMLITNTVPAVPLPIRQGATVQLNYDVIVPGTGGSPATTTHVNVITHINEKMLYPKGSTSISLTANSGLNVGDLFVINGEIKRVIYASPTLEATADTGPANMWIAFFPALEEPLYRDTDLVVTTHWAATFDSTGKRMSWVIPALPPTIPELKPSLDKNVSSHIPKNNPLGDHGDHIDFLFSPIDDNQIEGEEAITLTAIATGSTNGYTLGDPQAATFRVGDNDISASIEVLSNPMTPKVAGEQGLDGAFRVNLTDYFRFTNVRVPFSVRTNPGDAVFGVDYTIEGASPDASGKVSGSIVFTPGARSIIVPVKVRRETPVGTALPINISLSDSFDYVLAGTSGGNAGSNAATLSLSDRSTVVPPEPVTPEVPVVDGASENNGGGCGAGSGIAILLLGAWLALARFRLRNR
jgi:hypothetical protein